MCICESVCGHSASTHTVQKRAADGPGTGVTGVWESPDRMLEFCSFARTPRALIGRALSPAPVVGYFVNWIYLRTIQVLCADLATEC